MKDSYVYIPVLYSPKKPVYFLGFFTSWIRFRICPWGSGSGRPFLIWIRIRNIAGASVLLLIVAENEHCEAKPLVWSALDLNIFQTNSALSFASSCKSTKYKIKTLPVSQKPSVVKNISLLSVIIGIKRCKLLITLPTLGDNCIKNQKVGNGAYPNVRLRNTAENDWSICPMFLTSGFSQGLTTVSRIGTYHSLIRKWSCHTFLAGSSRVKSPLPAPAAYRAGCMSAAAKRYKVKKGCRSRGIWLQPEPSLWPC